MKPRLNGVQLRMKSWLQENGEKNSIIPLKVLSNSRERNRGSSVSLGEARHSYDREEADSLISIHEDSQQDMDANFESGFRMIEVGRPNPLHGTNAVTNTKYDAFSFLPKCLFEQFRYFYNMYFLLVSLSQLIPPLKIGYLSTYIAPLIFVLMITLTKEAIDDLKRRRRDSYANNEIYIVNNNPCTAQNIQVGDVVLISKDQRVPADMVLMHTSVGNEAFIRTDQLDGETDWKLRIPCSNQYSHGIIHADSPIKSVHHFYGTFTLNDNRRPLTVDNTLWANTVLASEAVYGVVIYTGKDTRQSLNSSKAKTKVGLLEKEINFYSKILCMIVLALSVILTFSHGIRENWYIAIFRYLILFSSIIPINLRVNLDIAKIVHSKHTEADPNLPDVVVRSSNIPEELGRIEYLLTDKTGTLTQNEMELKKLQLGVVGFSNESMDVVQACVNESTAHIPLSDDTKDLVRETVLALSLCHNVTPSETTDGSVSFQAASPDEVAIVRWTSSMGLVLTHRNRTSITINTSSYEILQLFPFKSETKRMGIVVRSPEGQITFYLKGADSVMQQFISPSFWLDEECGNMAREGLRTLVVAKKDLTNEEYNTFATVYAEASVSFSGSRDKKMEGVVSKYLENDMDLLGLTGVEDKLQKDVKVTLELLRNAGIHVWMLTGDKVETARCIAISSRLVSRGQYIHTIAKLNSREDAQSQLMILAGKPDSCLIIDGESMEFCVGYLKDEFIEAISNLSCVVICRCTPTQKANMTRLIQKKKSASVCCIGDGGNDVGMIQVANIGVGVVGKEGQQASLAADYSIKEFSHIARLLLWHGRISYKQTSKLAMFVIHRGLIISICQVVYSIISNFEPIALFQGLLLVGYSTMYTMLPVFSIVYDRDVSEKLVFLFPELYKEMREDKCFSIKSFMSCVLISIYQGVIIQVITYVLVGFDVEGEMLAVCFSCLILNELIMVALQINRWDQTIVMSEMLSLMIYTLSVPFLTDYFDLKFFLGLKFYWVSALILFISLLPVWSGRALKQKLKPSSYAKLQR
ncbi:P-type ATPase [Schizosaccharomyces octosporus yFS286]|uniref:Phospholipid-transporting ATPase n=1 Tax=Schizosaccharomyces octosporus (strain yFS286) TaxID=483514 RepID=S9PT56_SCHOY|nr:P-type ATPase [Schizosaccharomyces octosporus yFS286]EPX70673.1 P-type ATPase [Schizosaccharomyces octosporus yFS286]